MEWIEGNLCRFLSETKDKGYLSTSLEKKIKIRDSYKTGKSIYCYLDLNIISKALSEKLKKVLDLITWEQMLKTSVELVKWGTNIWCYRNH